MGWTAPMTTNPDITLDLAGSRQLEELLPLVAAYHAFEALETSAEQRRSSVAKLLQDKRLGEMWLIRKSDILIGYIAICYSYSIEFGGRDALIDEFYIEPVERGRGIGSKVLVDVAAHLRTRGIVVLHLEVDGTNERAKSTYARAGFSSRDRYHVMSLVLAS
jgi:ribosomal protein S18 acetylase RimI-like enzyme